MTGSHHAPRLQPKAASAPVPNDRPRSLIIDLLRILCASLLFYYHAGRQTHWFLSDYAAFASGTFIALAGYCAVRYSRYREALKHPSARGALRYFLDRFVAIYPAYAIITLLIFAGSFLYPAQGRTGPFTVVELLCNLLMVNQYLGMNYFTNMMWFVPFILQLYLLVPVLCILAARAPRLGIVACSLFSLLACLLIVSIAPAQGFEICKEWSPLFRLTPAFLGVAAGLASSPALLPALLLLWILCSGARMALLPWLPSLEPVAFRSLFSALTSPLILAASCAIAAFVQRWTPRCRGPIALLSRASLPFFLGHGVLMNFLWHHFGSNLAIWIGYFALCWAGSALFVIVYMRVTIRLRERLTPPPRDAAPKVSVSAPQCDFTQSSR